MIEGEPISVKTAAEILGITERAVRGLAQRGSIPSKRVDANYQRQFRPWLFDKADVLKEKEWRDRYSRRWRR